VSRRPKKGQREVRKKKELELMAGLLDSADAILRAEVRRASILDWEF
jgi:hypothetical protein